ncbi:putative mitochondrial protein, partial [Mucuna pruriens]
MATYLDREDHHKLYPIIALIKRVMIVNVLSGTWSLCEIPTWKLQVIGSNSKEIEQLKVIVKVKFEMTNLGKMSYFLGMKFTGTFEGIVLHQRKYVSKVFKRFNMTGGSSEQHLLKMNMKLESNDEEVVDDTLFKQSVGSLRYLSNSRLNIRYRVGLIRKFMDEPRKLHLVVAKRIMRNLL